MNLSVPRESAPGERRVALVPESCKKLIQAGYSVTVESGAGSEAGFADQAYQAAGAAIERDAQALLGKADFVLKVNAPSLGGGRDEAGGGKKDEGEVIDADFEMVDDDKKKK